VTGGSASTAPRWVITLVHGTWGQRSPWAFVGSSFTERLGRLVPGGSHFERFSWGGENWHAERHAAAERLTNHINELIRIFPKARHVVVAHSHGGNIALAALNLAPWIETQLDALVCLSTPFIAGRTRDTESLKTGGLATVAGAGCGVAGFVGTAAAILSLALIYPSVNWALRLFGIAPGWAPEIIAALTALIVGLSAMGVVAESVIPAFQDSHRRFHDDLEKRQPAFLSELSVRQELRIRMYVVTAWGDEPYFGLALSSLLGAIGFMLGRWLVIATVLIWAGGFVFAACVDPIWLLACPNCEATSDKVADYWANLAVGSLVLLAIISAVTPTWARVVHGKSFGLTLTDAIVARVTVGSLPYVTPPPRLRVFGLWHLLRRHGLKAIWRHSLIYDDDQAISEIGQWLDNLPGKQSLA
jgi:pimeloyl-ACP methyl ester carboxylesterase